MSEFLSIPLSAELQQQLSALAKKSGKPDVAGYVQGLIRRDLQQQATAELAADLQQIIAHDPLAEVTAEFWQDLRQELRRQQILT
jgi:predicted DNA-binding protein